MRLVHTSRGCARDRTGFLHWYANREGPPCGQLHTYATGSRTTSSHITAAHSMATSHSLDCTGRPQVRERDTLNRLERESSLGSRPSPVKPASEVRTGRRKRRGIVVEVLSRVLLSRSASSSGFLATVEAFEGYTKRTNGVVKGSPRKFETGDQRVQAADEPVQTGFLPQLCGGDALLLSQPAGRSGVPFRRPRR